MKKWVFVLAVIALVFSVVGGALIGYVNIQVKSSPAEESKSQIVFLAEIEQFNRGYYGI